MSAKDDLKNSLGNEKAYYKGNIEFAVRAVSLIPHTQRRLKEIEAEETVVDLLPDDVAEEIAQKMLPIQRNEELRASILLPQASAINDETIRYITTGSGTISVYEAYIDNVANYEYEEGAVAWVGPVKGIFVTLASDVERKNRIHDQLTKLTHELGDNFNTAEDIYEKARGGANLVSEGVMAMRDVLQSFWGQLTELARRKDPGKTRSYNGLEMRKEKHRKLVTECLVNPGGERDKLLLHFDTMADLHNKMSATDFGKNLFGKDIARMESIHTSWIILLSDLVGITNG